MLMHVSSSKHLRNLAEVNNATFSQENLKEQILGLKGELHP